MRNPAFRQTPGASNGGAVLFCGLPDGTYRAYHLNARALDVWHACSPLTGDATAGKPVGALTGDATAGKPVGALAGELAGAAGPDEIREFLARLLAEGLLCLPARGARAYFEHQEYS